MNKKMLMFIILGILCFNTKVFAATTVSSCADGTECSESYYSLEKSYTNISQTEVTSPNTIVTVYGKSECNGTSCEYSYASGGTNVEKTLSQSVKCTNGGNIQYKYIGSGKDDFLEDNKDKLDGTAYWAEDYFIACTNETGENIIDSNGDNTGGSNTGAPSTGGSNGGANTGAPSTGGSNGGANTGGLNSGNEYPSSSTVDSSETGVETYYIVLGIVGIISYAIMYVIRKYNLFKSI